MRLHPLLDLGLAHPEDLKTTRCRRRDSLISVMTKLREALSDTDSSSELVRARVLREMPPSRKVELVEDANRTSRLLALAGIRARHPELSVEQQQRLLMDLVLGKDLAEQVYGSDSDPTNR